MNVGDFIWPYLDAPNDVAAGQAAESRKAEIAEIRATNWTADAEAALEEARRLTDAEHERRKSADLKATSYLAVVGVFLPILTSSIPLLFDPKADLWLRVLSAPVLAMTIAYLVGTGRWAFKAMAVSKFLRVDPSDLVQLWSTSDPTPRLTAELLVAVRASRDYVNQKISAVLMIQHFILRAFFTFTLLLLLQVLWQPLEVAATWLTSAGAPASQPRAR